MVCNDSYQQTLRHQPNVPLVQQQMIILSERNVNIAFIHASGNQRLTDIKQHTLPATREARTVSCTK